MKKQYALNGEKVLVVKDLKIEDKYGKWFQIEVLSGKEKGMRRPVFFDDKNKLCDYTSLAK